MKFDQKDRAILCELERNARVSNAELGRRVGLSPPAVGERVARLEEAGVIEGYRAVINPAAIGASVLALMSFKPTGGSHKAMETAVLKAPQVTECYRLAGRSFLSLKVHARSNDELHTVVERLAELGETETSLVLASSVAPRPLTTRFLP